MNNDKGNVLKHDVLLWLQKKAPLSIWNLNNSVVVLSLISQHLFRNGFNFQVTPASEQGTADPDRPIQRWARRKVKLKHSDRGSFDILNAPKL